MGFVDEYPVVYLIGMRHGKSSGSYCSCIKFVSLLMSCALVLCGLAHGGFEGILVLWSVGVRFFVVVVAMRIVRGAFRHVLGCWGEPQLLVPCVHEMSLGTHCECDI